MEQVALIDTSLPNAKEIEQAARHYRHLAQERKALAAEEIEAKASLIAAVKATGIAPDAYGTIICVLGELTITIKPRDELVRVKDGGAAADGDSDEA